MEDTKVRTCLRCGMPFHGRADKKFCCDDCRTEYHNKLRRIRDKQLRKVNCILSSNWRILSALLREGRTKVSVAELASKRFNFEIYTTTQKRIASRRIYWCYNLAYSISRKGIVHIFSYL